jgi:hypothetical protein
MSFGSPVGKKNHPAVAFVAESRTAAQNDARRRAGAGTDGLTYR